MNKIFLSPKIRLKFDYDVIKCRANNWVKYHANDRVIILCLGYKNGLIECFAYHSNYQLRSIIGTENFAGIPCTFQ